MSEKNQPLTTVVLVAARDADERLESMGFEKRTVWVKSAWTTQAEAEVEMFRAGVAMQFGVFGAWGAGPE